MNDLRWKKASAFTHGDHYAAGLKDRREVAEREDIQRRAFGRWVNCQLRKGGHTQIKDIFRDLHDGNTLLSLIEVFTGRHLTRERGSMKLHWLNNVDRALKILEDYEVMIINIRSDDIVKGNRKLILGLIWSIILHWQVKGEMKRIVSQSHVKDSSLESILLQWCNERISKIDDSKTVVNFTSSWSDGLALNALLLDSSSGSCQWATIIAMDTYTQRLEHALDTAWLQLGVDRLLDSDDFNCDIPDKKSIMMYIMCVFEKLTNDSVERVRTISGSYSSVSELSDLLLPSADNCSILTTSSHQSIVSCDVEFDIYLKNVEQIASWLHKIDNEITDQPVLSLDVNQVKEHFHNHEGLMLRLSAQQEAVGTVLDDGEKLIEQHLNDVEENEIRLQMRLLHQKWECLREKAMARQALLHQTLQTLQDTQLRNLAEWLDFTERYMGEVDAPASDMDTLKLQLQKHKFLQASLEQQQSVVNSLTHIVVVVNDMSNEEASAELEQKLLNLGERWGYICRWAEERWKLLKFLLDKWEALSKDITLFDRWVVDKEALMVAMLKIDLDDEVELLNQVKQLRALQGELENQQGIFATLSDSAQGLAQYLESSSPGVNHIQSKLDSFAKRWDSLVENIEKHSKIVASSKLLSTELIEPGEMIETVNETTSYQVVAETSCMVSVEPQHSKAVTSAMLDAIERETSLSLLLQPRVVRAPDLVMDRNISVDNVVSVVTTVDPGLLERFEAVIQLVDGWLDSSATFLATENISNISEENISEIKQELSKLASEGSKYSQQIENVESALSKTVPEMALLQLPLSGSVRLLKRRLSVINSQIESCLCKLEVTKGKPPLEKFVSRVHKDVSRIDTTTGLATDTMEIVHGQIALDDLDKQLNELKLLLTNEPGLESMTHSATTANTVVKQTRTSRLANVDRHGGDLSKSQRPAFTTE